MADLTAEEKEQRKRDLARARQQRFRQDKTARLHAAEQRVQQLEQELQAQLAENVKLSQSLTTATEALQAEIGSLHAQLETVNQECALLRCRIVERPSELAIPAPTENNATAVYAKHLEPALRWEPARMTVSEEAGERRQAGATAKAQADKEGAVIITGLFREDTKAAVEQVVKAVMRNNGHVAKTNAKGARGGIRSNHDGAHDPYRREFKMEGKALGLLRRDLLSADLPCAYASTLLSYPGGGPQGCHADRGSYVGMVGMDTRNLLGIELRYKDQIGARIEVVPYGKWEFLLMSGNQSHCGLGRSTLTGRVHIYCDEPGEGREQTFVQHDQPLFVRAW